MTASVPVPDDPRAESPSTEEVNPDSVGIDTEDARGILDVIHAQDRLAWEAAGSSLDSLARLVDAVVEAFRGGGRLLYFGSGSSGRLGVLDAAECPPTFGVEPGLVEGRIAGGDGALRRAMEGAEDSPDSGARDVGDLSAGERDVVCGISSSGTTPYVWGALAEARKRGATTALVHSNAALTPGRLPEPVDHVIALPVGPEVIAGSTRMKAGTATKMALNMLTTAAMIRWGRVHDNLMVDVVPTNRKLRRRACGLIRRLGGAGPAEAEELLERAGGRVKVAVVMKRAGLTADEALRVLASSDDRLRDALHRAGAAPDRPGGR